ncbi:RidA family protein [Roseibium sp. M-1]
MPTAERNAKRAFDLQNPAGLYDPSANGYSHLAILDPGVCLVQIAGQGGETEDGNLPREFREQVRQAFRNLKTALAAADATLSDVFKLTVLIVDHSEERLHVLGDEVNAAFGSVVKPTCTLIPVPRLALDGMLFEVEATAVLRR